MKTKKLLPPDYLFILIVLQILLQLIFPNPKVIPCPINFIGLIMMLGGITINIWADSYFKKERTTVKPFELPQKLITTGPFAYSRHPMYLGFLLIILGIAVLIRSLISFVPVIILAIILEKIFISYEEKVLKEKFGPKYNTYQQKVRKWF